MHSSWNFPSRPCPATILPTRGSSLSPRRRAAGRARPLRDRPPAVAIARCNRPSRPRSFASAACDGPRRWPPRTSAASAARDPAIYSCLPTCLLPPSKLSQNIKRLPKRLLPGAILSGTGLTGPPTKVLPPIPRPIPPPLRTNCVPPIMRAYRSIADPGSLQANACQTTMIG